MPTNAHSPTQNMLLLLPILYSNTHHYDSLFYKQSGIGTSIIKKPKKRTAQNAKNQKRAKIKNEKKNAQTLAECVHSNFEPIASSAIFTLIKI